MVRAKADITTVFRRLMVSVSRQQRRSDSKSWRWAEGVHIFPDSICPVCNIVMQSSCLWQIDERAQKLVAIVGVVDKRLVRLPVTHPHMYSAPGGVICMGNAPRFSTGAVAQAVLMGMNPNDCMGRFDRSGDNAAWRGFFRTYFPDHTHLSKKKRARPRLFKRTVIEKKVAPAVRRTTALRS